MRRFFKRGDPDAAANAAEGEAPQAKQVDAAPPQTYDGEERSKLPSPFVTFSVETSRAVVDGIPSDRRVVLLGESTHGTEEFYQIRAEVTKRLITERGFTAVVFEADWPFMEAANEYAHGRRMTPFLDGEARFPSWMWQNQCMVDFFMWCKRQAPATTPYLFGMDCYSLFESKKAVISFLESHDPEFAKEVQMRMIHSPLGHASQSQWWLSC